MSVPMMSWLPRMIDMKLLSLGPAGQDVKAERQAEVDRGHPEWIVDRAVVVLDLRIAGHHHALQAQILDAPEILDALFDRSHRGLPRADEAIGMRRAVAGDPLVVSVEAGFFVIVVLVIAEQHP